MKTITKIQVGKSRQGFKITKINSISKKNEEHLLAIAKDTKSSNEMYKSVKEMHDAILSQ